MPLLLGCHWEACHWAETKVGGSGGEVYNTRAWTLLIRVSVMEHASCWVAHNGGTLPWNESISAAEVLNSSTFMIDEVGSSPDRFRVCNSLAKTFTVAQDEASIIVTLT